MGLDMVTRVEYRIVDRSLMCKLEMMYRPYRLIDI
jgi:hypothetical protein